MREQIEMVDLELHPETDRRAPARAAIVGGAIVLFALLLGGAYLATSDDDSTVDAVASEEDDVSADEEDLDEGATPSTTVAPGSSGESDAAPSDGEAEADQAFDAASDGDAERAILMAEDAAYGGEERVVFDGGRFVALGYGPGGPTVRTSDDGVSWEETPFPTLSPNTNVSHLAAHDGQFAVVVEQWPESEGFDEEYGHYLAAPPTPKISLAHSTDLAEWTFTDVPLPDPDGEPAHVGVAGMTLGDAGAVILAQSHPLGDDEIRLLVDAGLIDLADLDQYCGLDIEGESGIDVQLCDHEAEGDFWEEFEAAMESATTDDERREIERTFEESYPEVTPEVVATIEPGDPLFDRLMSLYEGEVESFPTNHAIAGPVGGPFTATTLGDDGYGAGIVEHEGAFVVVLQRWEREDRRGTGTVLSSPDGVRWTSVGEVSGSGGQLVTAGSSLLSIGFGESAMPEVLVSNDGGTSWSAAGFATELFEAYPLTVSGPAGVAVLVQGPTEPYPEFAGPTDIEVEKDGYVLTMEFTEEGRVTLTGPDGTVIYDLSQQEMYDGSADDKVRLGRLSGSQTFLDPATGDDLVSFTGQDFEAAYGEIEEPIEPDIEHGIELWFSSDGSSWSTIEDARLDVEPSSASLQLVAVGDDELIVAVHRWTNPPDELFAFEMDGREPTLEEEQALNQWFEENGEGGEVEYLRIAV